MDLEVKKGQACDSLRRENGGRTELRNSVGEDTPAKGKEESAQKLGQMDWSRGDFEDGLGES